MLSETPRPKAAGRPPSSTRLAVLDVIAQAGRIDSVREIPPAVARTGRRIDTHQAQHILNVLEKAGQVKFQRGRIGRVATYSRIEPTEAGRAALAAHADRVEVSPPAKPQEGFRSEAEYRRRVEPTQTAAEIEDDESSSAVEWPALAALRARQDANAAARVRADRLLEAASHLEDVDAEEAARLEAKAEELAKAFSLSPIEDEYLRFAASREGA